MSGNLEWRRDADKGTISVAKRSERRDEEAAMKIAVSSDERTHLVDAVLDDLAMRAYFRRIRNER